MPKKPETAVSNPVLRAKSVLKNRTAANEKLLAAMSASLDRAALSARLGTQFSGNRDMYAVLGYNREPTFDDYLGAYERGDIAQRIIDAKPESTWRRTPVISNDGDPEIFTPFEMAWATIAKKRRVFHYLERADRLSGIGEYGALLIGTDDVRKKDDMKRPMAKLKKGPDSVLYLTPLTEDSAEIESYDTDPGSERFGLPETYLVTLAGADTAKSSLGSSLLASDQQMVVHWSRMIHIAEGLRENDVFGTPRLKAVLNKLYDIDKISGGSAEIFWQAAKRIMVMQAKEGFSAVDNPDAMTEMMDEMIHGLRRVIDVQGYDVKTLDPSEVKPDEAFRVALALVSGVTGIPQRILIGSEQGKMASSQDETNWNGRIADRQTNFAEPVILRPFIDRLIKVGGLPNPGNEYTVTWQSLFELTDKEKATIGLLRARAMTQYAGKAGESFEVSQLIVPLDEFRSEVLNLRSLKVENITGDRSADIIKAPIPPAPAVPSKPALPDDTSA